MKTLDFIMSFCRDKVPGPGEDSFCYSFCDTAGLLGLYILVTGNDALDAVVTAQDYTKDTQVPVGTTIKLEFADTKAAD